MHHRGSSDGGGSQDTHTLTPAATTEALARVSTPTPLEKPHMPPHARPNPVKKIATAQSEDTSTLPEWRYIPPLPKGEFTKEMGEACGKLICDTYPEVFND